MEPAGRSTTAQATDTTFISNTGQATSGLNAQLHSIGAVAAQERVQVFSTGDHSDGYFLTSIGIEFQEASSSPPTSAKVFEGGTPTNAIVSGTAVAELKIPSSISVGVNDFEAPDGTKLKTDTDYFVWITGGSGLIRTTASNSEDSGGGSGWSIFDQFHTRDAGSTNAFSTHDNSLKINVKGLTVVDMVKNYSQTTGSFTEVLTNVDVAQTFRTGDNTGGYALDSISISFNFSSNSPPTTAKVFEGSSLTNTVVTGTAVADLTTPSSVSAGGHDFDAPSGTTLKANTDYFVMFAGGTAVIQTTVSNAEDSGKLSGWSIGNTAHRRTGGSSDNFTTQSNVLRIAVKGASPAGHGRIRLSHANADTYRNAHAYTYADCGRNGAAGKHGRQQLQVLVGKPPAGHGVHHRAQRYGVLAQQRHDEVSTKRQRQRSRDGDAAQRRPERVHDPFDCGNFHSAFAGLQQRGEIHTRVACQTRPHHQILPVLPRSFRGFERPGTRLPVTSRPHRCAPDWRTRILAAQLCVQPDEQRRILLRLPPRTEHVHI